MIDFAPRTIIGFKSWRITSSPASSTSCVAVAFVKNRRCVSSRMPLGSYANLPASKVNRTVQAAMFGRETMTWPPSERSVDRRRSTPSGSTVCSEDVPEHDQIEGSPLQDLSTSSVSMFALFTSSRSSFARSIDEGTISSPTT